MNLPLLHFKSCSEFSVPKATDQGREEGGESGTGECSSGSFRVGRAWPWLFTPALSLMSFHAVHVGCLGQRGFFSTYGWPWLAAGSKPVRIRDCQDGEVLMPLKSVSQLSGSLPIYPDTQISGAAGARVFSSFTSRFSQHQPPFPICPWQSARAWDPPLRIPRGKAAWPPRWHLTKQAQASSARQEQCGFQTRQGKLLGGIPS